MSLAFRAEGEGQPILCIHGWEMGGSVEAHDFEPVFARRPGYQRVYVDLPGHGSSPADGVHDLDAILETLVQFVEQNISPAKFLLSGSSCGAYLAMALAHRYSPSVQGLLLCVPVVQPLRSKRDLDDFLPAISNQAVLDLLPSLNREYLEDAAVQSESHMTALWHKLETVWLPATTTCDSEILGAIQKDPARYRLTAPFHNSLHPFTKPTLILTGRQDTSVGYRDGWGLLSSYPRATYIAIDRAGHGYPVDDIPLFHALVNDWLDRVAETELLESAK